MPIHLDFSTSKQQAIDFFLLLKACDIVDSFAHSVEKKVSMYQLHCHAFIDQIGRAAVGFFFLIRIAYFQR